MKSSPAKTLTRAQIAVLAATAFGVSLAACGGSDKKPAVSANEVPAASNSGGSKTAELPAGPPRDPSCGGTH